MVLREKIARGRIAARLVNVPQCLIGIEAGMATHYVARELIALGHDVKQVPPAYSKPFRRGHKNDLAIRDKTGAPFDGSKNYRLTVPANSPVKQYWSAVVYDRATHALIRNASRLSRFSQNPDLQKNTDGSVDVYFGPKAPAGKQTNWIPTNPGGKFEVLFRLYGPEKPLFDMTWKLPDIEAIK